MEKLNFSGTTAPKKLNRRELKNVFGGDFGDAGSSVEDNSYNTGTSRCSDCVKRSTKPDCGFGNSAVSCYVYQLI